MARSAYCIGRWSFLTLKLLRQLVICSLFAINVAGQFSTRTNFLTKFWRGWQLKEIGFCGIFSTFYWIGWWEDVRNNFKIAKKFCFNGFDPIVVLFKRRKKVWFMLNLVKNQEKKTLYILVFQAVLTIWPKMIVGKFVTKHVWFFAFYIFSRCRFLSSKNSCLEQSFSKNWAVAFEFLFTGQHWTKSTHYWNPEGKHCSCSQRIDITREPTLKFSKGSPGRISFK